MMLRKYAYISFTIFLTSSKKDFVNVNKNCKLISNVHFISTFASINHEGTQTKINLFL